VQDRLGTRSRRSMVILAAGVTMLLVVVGVAFALRSADVVTGVTPLDRLVGVSNDLRIEDPRGDAEPPEVDLLFAQLRFERRAVTVTWNVAGPFPRRPQTYIDLRAALQTDHGSAYVVLARLVRTGWQAGLVECHLEAGRTPICPRTAIARVRPDPDVSGRSVSVTVPIDSLPGLPQRFEWSAYTENIGGSS
jgi:hypothetical protein